MRIAASPEGRPKSLPAGGLPTVLMMAALVVGLELAGQSLMPIQANASESPTTQVAQLDAGREAASPAGRKAMMVPFADGLWVPVDGTQAVSIPDEQMTIVGLNEAMRVYARAGGGGGGGPTNAEWRPGTVFVRIAPGLYWPLEPRQSEAGTMPQRPLDQRPGTDPRMEKPLP